ncbi:ferredoxin family protein [Sphaerimonospora cavernae]|uniref:Ferredoxin family protein n=1 Tax=Sphaerimonospora cavernae TaxID=1740611 RepID=A0ABV6UCD4_9ACTN
MSEQDGGTPRESRGTLVIAGDRCKGCELCVAACPPQVLTMSSDVNEMGYRYPELTPGCTGCTACQMVCPDFVFEVYRFTPAAR